MFNINFLSELDKDMYVNEQGYELSKPYDEDEWIPYVKYLKQLNHDPSYAVSIAGLYTNEDDSVQVIYKVRSLHS